MVSFLRLDGDLDFLRAGEDRVVDLRRQIFRELGGQRVELLVLLRDDLVGAALLLAQSVELLLVAVAEPHQPARGAEQLLIVLEQLLEQLAVDAIGETSVVEQLLRGRDNLLFGRK